MTTQTIETAPTDQEIATARHSEILAALRFTVEEIRQNREEIAALKAELKVMKAQPAAPAIAREIVFNADTMTATVDDGKVYWKVKGEQYQKYGVTIWPEVLADAGYDVDALNPLKAVDLSGFVAICTVKENGKPKKVIRLETGS